MRHHSQNAALLRQVRAWQKAILSQLRLEGSGSDSSLDRLTRHLILILLVLRILEPQGKFLFENQKSDRLYPRLVERWLELGRSVKGFAGLPVSLALLPDLPLPDRLLRSILDDLSQHDLFQHDLHQSGKLSSRDSISALGQVYETLLIDQSVHLTNGAPASEKATRLRSSQRKSQGIYYTPEAIVQFMVNQTIEKLFESTVSSSVFASSSLAASDRSSYLSPISSPQLFADSLPTPLPRLLDPACGSGAFLLEAYWVLLDWQLQQLIDRFPTGHEWLDRGASGEWQLSWAARQQILQHCIYGVDLDPEAVSITQLSLWLTLLDGTTDRDQLPALNANLRVGNALLAEEMNWETAFPAVMRSGGFDAVIGNPPYLDSEQMAISCPTWRTYCATHYQTATGNWDLFCVFIEKALMLCRAGGITSLIVPNKLASAPYAAKARSLLRQHRLLLIRDYAQVPVFAASVYPLVYLVQKVESREKGAGRRGAGEQEKVRYEVMEALEQVQRSGWLSESADHPEACWQLTESPVQAQVMARLQLLPTLGSIAQVYGAATVAEAYALQPLLQECQTPTPADFRFVNSGTIDRYTLLWGKKPTRYLGQVYQQPMLQGNRLHLLTARRQQQAKQPKIIVAGLSQQLECALDAAGNVLAGKSTCIVLGIPPSIDWRYLLAVLNSRLLTAYFRYCSGGNQLQGGYLRVGTAQLKSLPIYLPDFSQAIDRTLYAEILELVQQTLMQRNSSEIDFQIEQRIRNLYRLTDEEAAVIQQTHSSKDSKRLLKYTV